MYPDALEFKHQNKITLNLFANSPDDHSRVVVRGCDLCHRLARLIRGHVHPVERLRGQPEFGQAGNEIAVRAAHRVAEQLEQAVLHALRDHVLPAARLDVYLLPRQLDDPYQQALGQPVLAHHPGGERPAVVAQREVPVPGHVHQAVPLHPGHRLAHGGAALRQPLGDARAQRDDALLFEFEDGTEVHLRRVNEPLGCQLLILLLVMLCRRSEKMIPQTRRG